MEICRERGITAVLTHDRHFAPGGVRDLAVMATARSLYSQRHRITEVRR
jgi:hypothetical protein